MKKPSCSFIFWNLMIFSVFPVASSFAADVRTGSSSTISRRTTSSSSRTTSNISSSSSSSNNSQEYTQEDCASKYILGLDSECYNENNVDNGGVYADCKDYTMAEYYDAMDMQLAKIVGISKFSEFKENCDAYKSYALEKWLSSKSIVENSALKGSSKCILANKKLTAAKKCYAAAIAHDGNFFEFSELMTQTCGEMPDVASKFASAGDMSLSNIPQILENYSTLQFTNKSENWRTAVEAVLAGYIYDARQACGEENYDIITLNQFTEDKRENLLTETADSFANAFGDNLGRRASNFTISGSPTIQKDPKGKYDGMELRYYEGIGFVDINDPKYKRDRKFDYNKYGDITPQLNGSYATNNIYAIEGVSSINSARARLLNIIATGDVGTSETQDSIDVAIITGLGGRVGTTDTGLYNVISNLQEGDTFIIKQTDKVCQILVVNSDGELSKLSKPQIYGNKSLSNYVKDCKAVIE